MLFDGGALEEIGVVRGPEFHRIGEDEVAEVGISDQSIVDQFVSFMQHFGHIWNVEMADVRAENRAEARIERIGLRVERPCINRVVGLAAEVEAGHEQFADILRMLDAAGGEIVE